MSPERIETLLERAFSEAAISDRVDADDSGLFVAEADRPERDRRAVVGVADVALDDGTLRWLHVHPDYRGEGAGTALFDRARDAVEGETFLGRFGLSQVGTGERSIGSAEFHEYRYAREGTDIDVGEPKIDVPEAVTADGRARPVDRDDPIPGRESPFFRLRESESGDGNYGYVCGQCGSVDVVGDGLDRLNCGDCGNEHLADEWDGAYL